MPTDSGSDQTRGVLRDAFKARRPGWSLPQAFYTDDGIYRREMQEIFRHHWLFAAHSCQVAEPHDYVTFAIDGDSVVIWRDSQSKIQAFYNTCRHRGSRLVTERQGQAAVIVCPYHQWSYDCKGKLLGSAGLPADVDKKDLGLIPCHVMEVAGLVFISLAETPPDFSAAAAEIGAQLRPHGLDRAKVAYSHVYDVQANWKLIWENNRECFHCRKGHPEYIQANYDTASPDDAKVNAEIAELMARHAPKWRAHGVDVTLKTGGVPFFPTPTKHWRAARTVQREGWLTQSLDGTPVSKLMGDFTEWEMGNLRVSTLPNFWNHSNPDYAMSTIVTPLAANLTRVEIFWLVDKDAVEGVDYTLERLLPFWKITGEQDWRLCETNHAGVISSRYRPGPYSPTLEYNVEHFANWCVQHLETPEAEGDGE